MADIRMAKKADKKLVLDLTEKIIAGEMTNAQARAKYKRLTDLAAADKARKDAKKADKKALKQARKSVGVEIVKAQAAFDAARNRESLENWEIADACHVPIPGMFIGKAEALEKAGGNPEAGLQGSFFLGVHL